MPRYDYECQSCQNIFEIKQGFNDEPVANCPSCHSVARRKFRVVPIIYKGTGFYTTDYARSSVKANGTAGDSTEPSKTTDTDKQDSKPETSKDNKSETSKDNKPDSKPSAPPS